MRRNKEEEKKVKCDCGKEMELNDNGFYYCKWCGSLKMSKEKIKRVLQEGLSRQKLLLL